MPSWLLCVQYAVRVAASVRVVSFRLITESDFGFADPTVQDRGLFDFPRYRK
jgi:hypothetical protein